METKLTTASATLLDYRAITHDKEPNGYVCFYGKKRIEVYAETSYGAQCAAAKQLGVSPKKQYQITVVLAEKNGQPVTHAPDF